jgi:hypothetical protein
LIFSGGGQNFRKIFLGLQDGDAPESVISTQGEDEEVRLCLEKPVDPGYASAARCPRFPR